MAYGFSTTVTGRVFRTGILGVLIASSPACGSATWPGLGVQGVFQFSQGTQGWESGVSDYFAGENPGISFVADLQPLPSPLDTNSSALFMSSVNHSDDVFMFWKDHFAGLAPGATYTARFVVEIASDTPNGCAGVGGQPGEAVFVKAGATQIEPIAVLNSSGYYAMNIDKGNQSVGGANAVVLGNIATTISCGDANSSVWQLKQLNSGSSGVPVQAGTDGSVWLLVGTDSGFEGPTAVYITQFTATFERN